MNLETQHDIVEYIYGKLRDQFVNLRSDYDASKDAIGFFYLDDILPDGLAKQCFEVFPDTSEMRCLKSIREHKYVSAQMNQHHKLLENILYAFQDPKIVKIIGEITGLDSLYADESLYAGGLSLMADNNFLNPHLDNSHDAERQRWRVLNLLYYVTPNWQLNNGGHLELWPNGPKDKPVLIESKFNRLIVMATHQDSWHSVNMVSSNDLARCCISNYYFSDVPLKTSDKFHVTKFSGRPNETFKNLVLGIDAKLRMTLRKIFKKGIRKNPHIYKDKVDN